MKEIQEWNGGKAKITVGYGIEIRNIITKCDFFFSIGPRIDEILTAI